MLHKDDASPAEELGKRDIDDDGGANVFSASNRLSDQRIRSLQFWKYVGSRGTTSTTQRCDFGLTNGHTVKANLVGTNANQSLFHAADLQTGLGTYAHTTLRSSSISRLDIAFTKEDVSRMCPSIREAFT